MIEAESPTRVPTNQPNMTSLLAKMNGCRQGKVTCMYAIRSGEVLVLPLLPPLTSLELIVSHRHYIGTSHPSVCVLSAYCPRLLLLFLSVLLPRPARATHRLSLYFSEGLRGSVCLMFAFLSLCRRRPVFSSHVRSSLSRAYPYPYPHTATTTLPQE